MKKHVEEGIRLKFAQGLVEVVDTRTECERRLLLSAAFWVSVLPWIDTLNLAGAQCGVLHLVLDLRVLLN